MEQRPNQWQSEPPMNYTEQHQYQPPVYQQPPQPPVKPPAGRSKRPWLWIVIALIIGFAVGYAAHVPPTSDTTTTTSVATAQPTNQPTQVPTKAVTPTPTHALKWTTVQTFSGNGTKKTSVFNVPGDWKLVWTCDPASFGGSYNVIVDVDNADSTPFDAGAVNTICASGNTHGETEEHQSGQVYLAVNSEAAWSISIQELK